jgi:hypothetical protein
MEDQMIFELALSVVKQGGKVYRAGWNGKGMWIEMQRPEHGIKTTLPFLIIRTAAGEFVPWTASQEDLFANDWSICHV